MSETCPICQTPLKSANLTVNPDTVKWLNELKQIGVLDSWLFYSKTIHEQAQKGATTQVISESIQQFEKRMTDLTEKQLSKFGEINQQELSKLNNTTKEELIKFSDMTKTELGKSTAATREEIGKITIIAQQEFGKFSTLTQEEITKFSTNLTTIATNLSEQQHKPIEIGQKAERGVVEELEFTCSEDCIEYIGGKGQADIIVKPKHNNIEIGYSVIVEVKKTNSWKNEFVAETEKFMGDYNTPFGILASQVLPATAALKGFSVQTGKAGIIIVTQLENAGLTYQILRKILITFHQQGKQVGDFRALFKDEEIQAILTKAKDYAKYVKTIRTHLRGIETELTEMQNQLDKSIEDLTGKFTEVQQTKV